MSYFLRFAQWRSLGPLSTSHAGGGGGDGSAPIGSNAKPEGNENHFGYGLDRSDHVSVFYSRLLSRALFQM